MMDFWQRYLPPPGWDTSRMAIDWQKVKKFFADVAEVMLATLLGSLVTLVPAILVGTTVRLLAGSDLVGSFAGLATWWIAVMVVIAKVHSMGAEQ